MEEVNENDVGKMVDFLFNRIDNIHFASIILLDTIISIECCIDSDSREELIKERDKIIKSIVNLSSMEV